MMLEVEKAQEMWKISRCEEIGKAETDKEKWKKINKLTNNDQRFDIQPIRKINPSTKKKSIICLKIKIFCRKWRTTIYPKMAQMAENSKKK